VDARVAKKRDLSQDADAPVAARVSNGPCGGGSIFSTEGKGPIHELQTQLPSPAMQSSASSMPVRSPATHAPRTGGSCIKDPRKLPPASRLPPPSVTVRERIEDKKRSRSQRRTKDPGGEIRFSSKQATAVGIVAPTTTVDGGAGIGTSAPPPAALDLVADSPTGFIGSKMPLAGSLCHFGNASETAPLMVDGSRMVVPQLKFSPRAQDEAKAQAQQTSGLSLLMQTPDECPLPSVFLFFSEDPEERAALTIQHYTRAWLERRMVRYLQTMRRLVLLLATRERKAARLIRERWLTKVILERNSQRLRPLLEALLHSVCIDKPDRLLDYATEWMRMNFPYEATDAASAECKCIWSPRDDIEATQDALISYLDETNATAILEGIIERAISAQPDNVHAYVLDELVAQNPDILLPSSDEFDEDDRGISSSAALHELAAAEEALAEEELEEEEEELIEEEAVLLELEELDAEEEVLDAEEEMLDAEEEEAVLQEEEAEVEIVSNSIASPMLRLSLSQSPLGTLGTLEEELGDEVGN